MLLGIPLNGVDPKLTHLGTKSGSRKVFREAGIDLRWAWRTCGPSTRSRARSSSCARRSRTCAARWSSSTTASRARATRCSASRRTAARAAIREGLQQLEFAVPSETPRLYFDKFSRMGGIVEEFIEAPQKFSPSAQLRVSPRGEVDARLDARPDPGRPQRAGVPGLQLPRPRRLPAAGAGGRRAHRPRAGQLRRGQPLRRRTSWSTARATTRSGSSRRWRSTCAWEAPRTRTSRCSSSPAARSTRASGLFLSPSGHAKYYRATDNLKSEHYKGLLPEDLIDILTFNKLHYNHHTESGVLFHLIGARVRVRQAGPHRHRQQPRRGGRPLPAHARHPRRRDVAGALTLPAAQPRVIRP